MFLHDHISYLTHGYVCAPIWLRIHPHPRHIPIHSYTLPLIYRSRYAPIDSNTDYLESCAGAHRHPQIDVGTHAGADTNGSIYKYAQIRLCSYFWILFLMFFISMPPTSCSGAWAIAHPQ